MSYLGSWKIDDLLTFPANTHRFDTGAATDADSAATYRVYEDETSTPLLTGSMALLDSGNTAGFYTEQITLSAANGFEKGKSYTIYISATVNSVTGTTSHTFQMEAEVDANIVSDKTGYGLANGAITAAVIATNAIDADAIADNAIDAGAIAADAITAAKIADGAIDANTFASGAITATAIATDAIGSAEFAQAAADKIWASSTRNLTALGFTLGSSDFAAGFLTASLIATGAIDADALATDAVTEIRSLVSGTSDSGSTTTMVDSARTEADTDYWKGAIILFTSGNISGQARLITGFDAATDTITFAPATTQTVATQTYEILAHSRVDVGQWLSSTPNTLQSGRVDSYLGAGANDVITAAMVADGAIDANTFASGAITASAIATDAIDNDAIAASAVTEIQSGLATSANQTTILSRIGTPSDLGSGASLSANLVDVEAQTDDIGTAGAGLTAIPWNATWDAQVESEVDDALVARGLDHLVNVAVAGADVTDDSIIARLVSKSATADWDSYVNTTDSLEANRDNLGTNGAALVLAKTTNITGFNDLSAAQVNAEADTALSDINLDHLVKIAVDTDFPTTVHLNSVIGYLADNGTTATFDRTTDSLEALAGSSAPSAATIADAVWDEALAGHLAAGSTGEALNAAGAAGDPWVTALPGAYGAGSAGNILGNNLNATVSSRATQTSVDTIDDFLDTEVAAILADTNELQTDWANGGRLDNILDARASQASIDTIDTNVDSILADTGTDGVVVAAASKTGYSLSAAGVQAIWDALTSALSTASSIGKLLVDNINTTISSRASQTSLDTVDDFLDTEIAAIKAKTDNLPSDPADASDIASSFSTVNSTLSTIAGYIDTEVAAILEDTGTTIPAQISALNNLSAAQVNAEIVDALNVDTYTEPGQEAPPATTTLAVRLRYLYKAMRNKKTQTATTLSLYDDTGTTVDQKATVSDNGSVYTHGELETGP